MVRVGGVIYDSGEIYATFVHGAWYRHVRKSAERIELEPLDAVAARNCENLPDALRMTMADGELAILNEAKKAFGRPFGSARSAKLVMAALREGVARGLRKYGPFRPSTEKRQLELEVKRCLRNAMVFASMRLCMSGGDRGAMTNVVSTCARLWLSVRDAEDN